MNEYASNIAAAVREAARRAGELQSQIGATGAEPAQPEGEPPNPPAQPETPPGPPSPHAPGVAPAQSPEQPQRQPEPAEQRKPDAGDDATWEHRYKSERGRRERLENQVRDLGSAVERLNAALAARDAQQTAEAPAAGPVLDEADLITEQERADYGDDLLGVAQKVARRVAREVSQPLQAEIARLKRQAEGAGQFVAQTARQRFFTEMDTAQPEWRRLNQDDGFLDWLEETDPFAGVPRKNLLDNAVQRFDATRAGAFFKGFLSQQEATAPRGTGPGSSTSPAMAGDGRPTLADLAAPGRAKGSGAEAPGEKPIWSQADIKRFYEDVRRGVFSGREAEKARYDADIALATVEGRIRN